jgi:hypothetical protein
VSLSGFIEIQESGIGDGFIGNAAADLDDPVFAVLTLDFAASFHEAFGYLLNGELSR